MASEPPPTPAPREALEQQDQSIKARKHQLFEKKEILFDLASVKRFSEYVDNRPPAPLSPGMKAALIGLVAVVALLFLAALFGGRGPRPAKPRLASFQSEHHKSVLVVFRSQPVSDVPRTTDKSPAAPAP